MPFHCYRETTKACGLGPRLKVDHLRFCGCHYPSISMLADFHFSRELLILVPIFFRFKRTSSFNSRIFKNKAFGLVLDSLQNKIKSWANLIPN